MREKPPEFELKEMTLSTDYESFLRMGFMSPREFLNSPEALRLILKYGRPGESIARTILIGKTESFSGLSPQDSRAIESRVQQGQARKGPSEGNRLLDLL